VSKNKKEKEISIFGQKKTTNESDSESQKHPQQKHTWCSCGTT
jgi:hypothetical protein